MREAVFEPGPAGDGPLVEFLVCQFHHRQLELGDGWSYDPVTRELLIGDDAPLDLVDWTITQTLGHPVLELMAGRDGIAEETYTIRVDPIMIREICNWVGPDEDSHPDLPGIPD